MNTGGKVITAAIYVHDHMTMDSREQDTYNNKIYEKML